MSNTNLTHALKRKHEAILTEIRAIEKTIKTTHKQMESLPDREEAVAKLQEDLAHVVAVIRLDNPDYDEAAACPRGKNTYRLPLPIGTCTRMACETLRESATPLTINQIAKTVLASSGLDVDDVELSRLACNNINASFRARIGKTLDHDDQFPQRWWVIGSKAELSGSMDNVCL